MLKLVVDTNLFHEFRPLEDLPWQDLGEDDKVELIVTDVVQTELDEHKKSTRPRLKRTAIKVTKQFRDMLLNEQDELEIKKSNPRVTLHLSNMNFGTEAYGTLDLTNLDDQLVAIAKKIADQNGHGSVRLFSNDTRPLRKARGVGVEILPIPDEWRREDEQTDDDKECARLKEENKRLRSQEPILGLSTDVPEILEKVLPVYESLTEDEIKHFMAMLLDANPQETDFERDKSKKPGSMDFGGITLGITQYEFKLATEETIDLYNDAEYPQWEISCRELLQEAHTFLSSFSQRFDVELSLSNKGTRPAEDLLFTVGTGGALAVMPPAYKDDKDDGEEEVETLLFPRAPRAPQGEWKQRRSIYNMAMHDLVGTPRSDMSLLMRHQTPRDPNSFYYQDRPCTYVKKYALTCAQFRHASDNKLFHCKCFVDETAKALDGKSAILEVSAEASNLSDPARLKVRIKFCAEKRSTYDAVSEIIDRLSPV